MSRPVEMLSTLEAVKTVLNIANEALAGCGIPVAASIPSIALSIISLYEDVRANTETMGDLLLHLQTLDKAFLSPMCEARLRGSVHVPEEVVDGTVELLNKLSKCRDIVIPVARLGTLMRVWRREQISTTLRSATRDIGSAVGAFQLRVGMTAGLLLSDLDSERVLSSLKPAAAGFSASRTSPCLPNTRSQLLHTLSSHLADQSHTFVCLYGSPGTGKSAVARSIATELHRDGLLAASYFFDRRGGDAINAGLETFVSTLAYQLAHLHSTFRNTLLTQLRQDPSLNAGNVDVRLKRLLLGPLKSIRAGEKPLVIVIDALDECGDSDHQRRLAMLLRRCIEAPESRQRVTFFLTSRPEASITDVLQHKTLFSAGVFHRMDEMQAESTQADIEAFVKTQFIELAGRTSVKSPMPSHLQIVEFAALAGGLFELAAIWLRQVHNQCVDFEVSLGDAIRVVQQIAQSSLSPEASLDGVYQVMMQAAVDGQTSILGSSRTRLGWYRDVIGGLARVRQPLALDTLSALVGVDERDARTILRPLRSVISVPSNGAVHFHHASFLEYLLSLSDARLMATSGRLIAPIHTTLAKRSLVIMNQLLRRNIVNLPDPSIPNSEILGLPRAIWQHIPGHLHYACLYWAEHLREEDATDCRDLLVHWCNEKIIFYLEVLSLVGEMERAVPLLVKAENWLVQLPQAEDVALSATLLADARRLVRMFYPAITRSAEAVYSSAIPFMPSSLIHTRYSHLAVREIVLVRGRLSTWTPQLWSQKYPHIFQSLAWSPDGRRIVTGGEDGVARIISASSGRTELVLKGHADAVRSIAFSRDGARVVSGSDDRWVRIWSAITGELEQVVNGGSEQVNSVSFSPDGMNVVSGSRDHSVRIWSAVSGKELQTLEGHCDVVLSVSFSPDGKLIASASADCSVRTWSASTGGQIDVLKGHTNCVRSVAFSPDGTRIVSGSDDCSVRVWSTTTGEIMRQLGQVKSAVRSVAFSPDGAHVVAASDDSVRIWSPHTGESDRVLEGHRGSVLSVAFSPDGTHFVTGSVDRSVQLWSVSCALQTDDQMPHESDDLGPIRCLAFSPDQNHIITGNDSGSLRVWSTTTGETEKTLEGQDNFVAEVAFSPDGTIVASRDNYDSLLLWNFKTGERLHKEPFIAKLWAGTVETHWPADGWLRIGALRLWVPNYLRGDYWLEGDVVAVRSHELSDQLALIRINSAVHGWKKLSGM